MRYGAVSPVQRDPYYSELTAKEEMDLLKEDAQYLKQQLEDVQQRIKSLQEIQDKQKDK